ncbi:MAG: hypothetical protein ACRD2E_02275 [Terriglobales bacterium]
MRKTVGIIGVLLLALPLWAHPNYAQLRAKAARAHGHKRAELLSRLAFMDFLFAEQSFEAGQSLPGHRSLGRLERDGTESVQLLRAEAARGKKSGMRNVEIQFQKIAYGLGRLRREANFRDQPAIGAARRDFSRWRRLLLAWMFARKKNGHLVLGPDQGQ